MTLSNRNRLFVFLTVFSLLLIAGLAAYYAFSFYHGMQETFPEGKSTTPFYSKSFLLRYSPESVLLACLLILFYVPSVSIIILIYFEKTNLQEISYLGIFLLSCLAEGLRITVPVFSLWKNNTLLMMGLTRLVFFGRLTASIMMLSIALYYQNTKDHQTVRSYVFILVFVTILSCVIPINSMQILSTCFYPYAYYNSFVFLRLLFIFLTFITYYITGMKYAVPEYKKCALYTLIIMIGHFFLQEGDSVLYVITGGYFFYFGTYLYLKNIHHYYLWK